MKTEFISNLPFNEVKKILSGGSQDAKGKLQSQLSQELDEMGVDSEQQAAKIVKKVGEERDSLAGQDRSKELTTLETKSHYNFLDYKRYLAEIMDQDAATEDYPEGWRYHIAVTDEGIAFYLKAPHNKIYARGFKPSNQPLYDRVAIDKILESAWVAIGSYQKGLLSASPPTPIVKP